MGRPKSMLKYFAPPKSNTNFSEGHKSKGIVDDYKTTKALYTQEFAGNCVFVDGGMCYGSCYGNEIMLDHEAMTQNVWYPNLSGAMVTGETNLVTHSEGALTVEKAGKYLVTYDLSVEVDAPNKHIQSAISGAVIYPAYNHLEPPSANIQKIMGGNMIIDLGANETIASVIRTTDTGTPDVIIDHVNLSVVQVGG